MMNTNIAKSICYCCGSQKFEKRDVLWKELIDEWRLSKYEVDYINRQQGLYCLECKSNLRVINLAFSLMKVMNFKGFLKDFIQHIASSNFKILEINQAGELTHWLSQIPGHKLIQYPEFDMMNLPFESSSFDVVIHSDTLEHVAQPIRALSECQRILKQERGFCIFTVPMIVDRLTTTRVGLPPSYHGSRENRSEDHLVVTEYGCDAWKQVIQAGFNECRIMSIDFPATQTLVGVN